MRAVAVRALGGPPELLDAPMPSPAPGEVRVRLEAAGVNPFDWKIADGVLRGRPHQFPLVLGVDGAGVVDALGPRSGKFRVGDRIFGSFLHDPVGVGTYAEYATVPESNAVIRVPEGLSSEVAATLPTSGMTAAEALEQLRVPRGGSLVVVGASGGVGSLVVPLARAAGLRVVAIARPTSHARLVELGAERAVDASGPDPIAEVRAALPSGADALLDLMSDAAGFARWSGVVRPGGAVATTLNAAAPSSAIRTMNVNLAPRADLLERLTKAIADGQLRPPAATVVDLAAAPGVVAVGRTGRLAGKTVIRLRPTA
jgi:NADPH:quinone reductase